MFNNVTSVTGSYARNAIRYNRGRNVISIIAIALAAFMLTAAFSAGINMLAGYDDNILQMNGTSAEAYLEEPTDEQIEYLRKSNDVSDVGISASYSNAYAADDINSQCVFLSGEDEVSFDMVKESVWGVEGEYPDAADEIMISNNMKESLGGAGVGIGDEISLWTGTAGELSEERFTISGIFSSARYYATNGMCYVSAEYARRHRQEGKKAYFKCTDDRELVTERLKKEMKISESQELAAMSFMDFSGEKMQLVYIIAFIIVMILVSAYLLIYNVFYISLSQDVRAYGLLKTLGGTKKQLKKVIYAQFLRLGAIGAVIGISLGLVVSMIGIPLLINAYSDNDTGAYWRFRFSIVAFTAVFTFIAVIISARKPARLIASLTAAESIRYMSNSKGADCGMQKSSSRPVSSVLAYRSVSSNKKRSALVIISLTLGLLIFVLVAVCVNSINADKYIDANIDADIQIENNSYFTEDGGYAEYDVLNKDIEKKMGELDSIKDVYMEESISYSTKTDSSWNDYLTWITAFSSDNMGERVDSVKGDLVGVDTEMLCKYKDVTEEYAEKFESGEYFYVNKGYEGIFNIPETIEAELCDGSSHTYRFGGYIDLRVFITGGNDFGITMIIPKTELGKISGSCKAEYEMLFVFADDADEKSAISEVEEYLGANTKFSIETKDDVRAEAEFMIVFLSVTGNGIAFVFVLLGIMNFVNLMSASVQSRKSELSMLESIGMTRKQIVGMLVKEGMFYAILSIAVSMPAGYFLSRYIVKVVSNTMVYASFDFPVVLMAAVCAIISLTCVLVPYMMYRGIAKSALSLRIRYE